jgi:hypothetical protein
VLWALTLLGFAVTFWLDQLLRQAGHPEPVLLGLAYAAVALVLGQLLGRDSTLVVAAATLAVAAVFQPARRRVQAAVDRRFNRRRYDAARTIQRSADGSRDASRD